MSVLVVGLSHRTAPTVLLEQASAGFADHVKTLHAVLAGEHVAEAVVLTTCNRVELYANVTTFHGGVAEVTDLLARQSGLDLEELSQSLYVHHDARAVQHLFSVGCGLDSMLLGESQILGQLRAAFRLAQDEGGVGRTLGEMFRHALRVAKRARTETGIDRAGASLVGVGLELARTQVGELGGRRALVVGAGSTAALAGATLRRAGVGEIAIANRSPERAERLAATLRGRAVPLEELPELLAWADLVVSTTASTGLVVEADVVSSAQAARGGRTLFLLDLALPRDVDPRVRELAGVTLADLDTLRAVLEAEQGGSDAEAVRRIVAEEVADFQGWQRAMRVAPTVVALRAKADALVADEMTRLSARLPELDPATRSEFAVTVQRVVEKLLHAPTVRVKELATAPGGDSYADALRELFELDRKAPEVVSTPEPAEPADAAQATDPSEQARAAGLDEAAT